ncbi:hypothetical protein DMH01_03420 [Amycolatopsis sp. WAC 04182]|uniref:hypothetical protein n=1 Tax=Amycolatopsis sp. WAC 04182 TaxID=2203198 RepID=UPI000F7963BF|nr:hypothetical protein [Amycolatopsis sp. WAC 04182]RSN65439.1 hypothetical protein DMH01_03420 [Amycolatopsis sp. WAC 04182]
MTEKKIPELRIGLMGAVWAVAMADQFGWVKVGSGEDLPDYLVAAWTPLVPSAATQAAEQARQLTEQGREELSIRLAHALADADAAPMPDEWDSEEAFWKFMVSRAVMPIVDELLAVGSPVTETTTQAPDAESCTCQPDVCFSEAEPVVCGYCSTADAELPCPIADADLSGDTTETEKQQ